MKVIIMDTSILCVWLKVPGKETCGAEVDRWDFKRVNTLINREIDNKSTLVLPLATIIETGNHISQSPGDRFHVAQQLAELMRKAADQKTPWAAFTDQTKLWDTDGLGRLADEWPKLVASRLSIGDATIKQVAEYYAKGGFMVEILTGDAGLKAYQPINKPLVPRRRNH